MEEFEKHLNDLIVEAFHLILKEEMKFINSLSNFDLSSREVHFLECVGKNDGKRTISDVSEYLKITLASVTVMANKLETGGYLTRTKDTKDGRLVLLSLTENGRIVDKSHYEFHTAMVKKISGKLTDFERQILLNGIKQLNIFLHEDLASDN